MRLKHKAERIGSDGNNHVRVAVPVLVKIKATKFPLAIRIGKYDRIQGLDIKLQLERRVRERGLDTPIYAVNCRI